LRTAVVLAFLLARVVRALRAVRTIFLGPRLRAGRLAARTLAGPLALLLRLACGVLACEILLAL